MPLRGRWQEKVRWVSHTEAVSVKPKGSPARNRSVRCVSSSQSQSPNQGWLKSFIFPVTCLYLNALFLPHSQLSISFSTLSMNDRVIYVFVVAIFIQSFFSMVPLCFFKSTSSSVNLLFSLLVSHLSRSSHPNPSCPFLVSLCVSWPHPFLHPLSRPPNKATAFVHSFRVIA